MEIKLLRAEVEDRCAQHVGGHEVGGELNAAEVGAQQVRERFGQEGFGHAGHAFEQHVAVGHEGSEQKVHGLGLSHHVVGHALAEGGDAFGESGEIETRVGRHRRSGVRLRLKNEEQTLGEF